MSLQLVAQHLAERGRGPDSTLVHMSNREVAGLNALAQKHGGHLTTNPQTGLPEAGFLDNILPMVAGGALTAFTGIDPLTAGAIVGGITGLESKDLSKGLVAGLGAWGGGSLANGLLDSGVSTLTQEGIKNAGGAQALGAEGATGIAENVAAQPTMTKLGAGLMSPGQTLATMGGGSMWSGGLPILAGLAPAITDYIDNPDESDNAPEQKKGYIRKYALDPVTGQYKQVGVYEAGGDPNKDVTSEAGTAGAFGAVAKSDYEKAHGMADGGVANSSNDSNRIYDYLMGRGPNPMQFTHVDAPQVDYGIKKPDAPITPTTGILETPFDQYGNVRGSGGQSQEQRDQRETALDAKSDYLSRPGLPMTMRDYWGLSSEERRLADADAAARNPVRGFIKQSVETLGTPVIARIASAIPNMFKGIPLTEKAPVTDLPTYETDVANDLQRQADLQTRVNQQDAANARDDGRADTSGNNGGRGIGGTSYGAVAPGYGGGSEAATGGLSTLHGFEHMAHGGISGHLPPPAPFYQGGKYSHKPPQVYADGGGIADLAGNYNLGSYSDGGRLLKGPGDGISDDIPAIIGHNQPARLADNEFVIPARIVSEIGNGSTDAGARALYKMMDRIQQRRAKTVGKDKIAVNSGSYKELDKL